MPDYRFTGSIAAVGSAKRQHARVRLEQRFARDEWRMQWKAMYTREMERVERWAANNSRPAAGGGGRSDCPAAGGAASVAAVHKRILHADTGLGVR